MKNEHVLLTRTFSKLFSLGGLRLGYVVLSLSAAAVITGSQKALAVQPGVSVIALSPEASARVESNKEKCMYLSLKEALKNGERGQTPFTPAVATLLQINARLRSILRGGCTVRKKSYCGHS